MFPSSAMSNKGTMKRRQGKVSRNAAVSRRTPLPVIRPPSEDFWRRVQSATRRLLMLDYDGTLAAFQVRRRDARLSSETLDILRRIIASERTRLVIVSGRPAEEVRALLGGLGVETFGAHGFERSLAEGRLFKQALHEDEIEGLEKARIRAVAAGLDDSIEVKPASVAIHVRGLEPDQAMEVEKLAYVIFSGIAKRHGLECRTFDGGVEVRSRRFHKGLVVESLLAESAEELFAVYVGDDETDEDALRAIKGRGTGIRVGTNWQDTAADFQLPGQTLVLPFLKAWLERTTCAPKKRAAGRRSRLVLVSNRLPSYEASPKGDRGRPVSGLATAVEAALARVGEDGLWLGWSGRVAKGRVADETVHARSDAFKLIGIDLTRREYAAYYNGFSNSTIWPLFHSFPGMAKLSSWEFEVYRAVNAMFARVLTSRLRSGDVVWVHDYHLLFLASELRRAGWKGPVGFFLHIPFPPLDLLAILPDFADCLAAMHEYDTIGFQTSTHVDNYVHACTRVLGARWDGRILRRANRQQRVGAYPIGIDVERFLPKGSSAPRARTRPKGALAEKMIVLGVDRLDYTKGLSQRVSAFEILLRLRPEFRRKVSLVQISSPSRTRVPEYREQKALIDSLVGRINGELGEPDWQPIHYLYRSYRQDELTSFYRTARVGLVTPLRDGMNLVAKEYVAAQDPEDPGALVLSRFAGAAEELAEAIMVNPYLPESTAQGIGRALGMPVEERRRRHAAMLEKVKQQTVHKWASDFVADLESFPP
jgi:trehalose 6-phosphate synthase